MPADWLKWGTEQQTRLRKLWTPQEITYVFNSATGKPSVTIPDAALMDNQRVSTQFGVSIDIQRREFIFETSYLIDDPDDATKKFFPTQGDCITWAEGTFTFEAEVQESQEEGTCWKWHDRYAKELRVFSEITSLPEGFIIR